MNRATIPGLGVVDGHSLECAKVLFSKTIWMQIVDSAAGSAELYTL